ncbi:MAG: hypothetical protein WCP82_10785 [Alphaproteobacteria bacterium]
MRNRTALLAVPALLLSLALSGCNGGGPSPGQQAEITKSIALGCTFIDVGSAAFDAYVAGHPGRIDASGLKWKAGVMATFKPICANPGAVADPAQTLSAVIKAGFALSDFIQGVSGAPAP